MLVCYTHDARVPTGIKFLGFYFKILKTLAPPEVQNHLITDWIQINNGLSYTLGHNLKENPDT